MASLHPPNLASTRGMITHEQPESMLSGSILLNTVCPLIVDQQTLSEVLPNVLLTPRWAGSAGNKQRRLGQAAIVEALRVAR